MCSGGRTGLPGQGVTVAGRTRCPREAGPGPWGCGRPGGRLPGRARGLHGAWRKASALASREGSSQGWDGVRRGRMSPWEQRASQRKVSERQASVPSSMVAISVTRGWTSKGLGSTGEFNRDREGPAEGARGAVSVYAKSADSALSPPAPVAGTPGESPLRPPYPASHSALCSPLPTRRCPECAQAPRPAEPQQSPRVTPRGVGGAAWGAAARLSVLLPWGVVTEDAALGSGAAEQSIPPSKGPGAAPVGVQQRVSAACLLGPARAGRV